VTIDIGRLPRRSLRAGTKLHRVHRRDPWYFDASPDARFNPIHADGRGTCYWAEQPVGAFIEAFRTMRVIAESDVQARRLSTITLETDLTVVNLTVKKALSAGVTAAITSGADYTAAQQLASDLQGHCEGIRYRARHDLSQQLICVALFGPQGDLTSCPDAGLPAPQTTGIPEAVLDDAARGFGYSILPSP
jgi:hypothetical protein